MTRPVSQWINSNLSAFFFFAEALFLRSVFQRPGLRNKPFHFSGIDDDTVLEPTRSFQFHLLSSLHGMESGAGDASMQY